MTFLEAWKSKLFVQVLSSVVLRVTRFLISFLNVHMRDKDDGNAAG